jgi:aspartate/methionine/tyrosine aminotransferase
MARELAHTDAPMIFLNIGEPDFTAPALVQEAAAARIRDGRTQYTQATGLPALRERISGWYASRFGVDVPARRIVVTAGASAALQLACLALIDAGDEVLMPDPSYPCNRHFVSAAEGRRGADSHHAAERFQLSADKVRRRLGSPHPRRASGVALEPHRHLDRPRGTCGASTNGARTRRRHHAGRRDLPRPEL